MYGQKINKSYISSESKGRRRSRSPVTKKEMPKKATKADLYKANDSANMFANFSEERYDQIKQINEGNKAKSDFKSLLSKKQVNIMNFLPPDVGVRMRESRENRMKEVNLSEQEEKYSEHGDKSSEVKSLKQMKLENAKKLEKKKAKAKKEKSTFQFKDSSMLSKHSKSDFADKLVQEWSEKGNTLNDNILEEIEELEQKANKAGDLVKNSKISRKEESEDKELSRLEQSILEQSISKLSQSHVSEMKQSYISKQNKSKLKEKPVEYEPAKEQGNSTKSLKEQVKTEEQAEEVKKTEERLLEEVEAIEENLEEHENSVSQHDNIPTKEVANAFSESMLATQEKGGKHFSLATNTDLEDELSAILGKSFKNVAEKSFSENRHTSNREEINFILEDKPVQKKVKEATFDKFISEIEEMSKTDNKISNVINDRNSNVEAINLAIELKETKKSLNFMKELMQKTRNDFKQQEELSEAKWEEKLAAQKKIYQAELEKLDNLNETLQIEKRQLVGNREELLNKLDCLERERKNVVDSMSTNFDVQLKKERDNWFKAEKLNRQKWEEKKKNEIRMKITKELEPDVQAIIDNSRNELDKAKRTRDEALKIQREEISEQYEARIAALKDRMREEKDEEINHERSKYNSKLSQQLEDIQVEHEEERRRWKAQLAAEADKIRELRENDRKSYEESVADLKSKQTAELEENKEYYKKRLVDMEEKIRDQYEFNSNKVKLTQEKKFEELIAQKEQEYQELKSNIKKNLDLEFRKKIDIAASKITEEAAKMRENERKKLEANANERNKFLEIENKQLKEKITDLTDKLSRELKVRHMNETNTEELAERCSKAEGELERANRRVIEIKAKYEGVTERLSNLEEEFNLEKQRAIDEINLEVEKMRLELAKQKEVVKNAHSTEEKKLELVRQKHEEELRHITSRVKAAIGEKNNKIIQLQQELETQELVIKKKEEMLEKQRAELLMG